MRPGEAPTRSRVFIVDDEPKVREALTLLLATAGLDTEEYASAEGFWDNIPGSEPICVLLDNRLPGMSGIDLLPKLLTVSPHAAVVMMTGDGDIPTAVEAMRRGAYHFVEKPFDAENLLTAVLEAVSRAERGAETQSEIEKFEARRALLTEREAEVYALLLEGSSSKAIAARLDVTVRTAEHHRAAVLRKFEVRSLSELLRVALPRNI